MHKQPARCQNHDCINVATKELGSVAEILRLANLAARKPMKDTKPKKQKTLKTTKHVPDPDQICVADLLCTAFVDVEEKSWRWYLLRPVAVCLEPYANLPTVDIGPLLLGQVIRQLWPLQCRQPAMVRTSVPLCGTVLNWHQLAPQFLVRWSPKN